MRIGYVPRGAHLFIFVKSFDPSDKSFVTTCNEHEGLDMPPEDAKKLADHLGVQTFPIT